MEGVGADRGCGVGLGMFEPTRDVGRTDEENRGFAI